MIDRVTRTRGLPSFALLAVLAVVASGCSAAALPSASATVAVSASGVPPIAPAEPTAAATTTATPSVAAASEPIASAAASAAPLADGDYVSGVVTHAKAEAMLNDPKVASVAVVKSFLAEFAATAVFTLQLKNPGWAELERLDGQDKGIGDFGTYAFVDPHTIAFQGNHGACVATFRLSSHAESVKWVVLTDFLRPRRHCGGSSHLPIHRLDSDALRCTAIGI